MPSQTAKTDPWRPMVAKRLLLGPALPPSGLSSVSPRDFCVRSATRKLSSLCSRICPTSVRAKTWTRMPSASGFESLPPGAAVGVWGCVTGRRSPGSCASAGRVRVEAEELLANAEVRSPLQPDFVANPQECAVRRAKVRQPESRIGRIRRVEPVDTHDRVTARQEGIVGEHDVARFASDDHLRFADMEHIANDTFNGALGDARIPWGRGCTE